MNILRKLSDFVSIPRKSIQNAAPEYLDPVLSNDRIIFEPTLFPDTLVRGDSRVYVEAGESNNRENIPTLTAKAKLSTLKDDFVSNSETNKYEATRFYGAGTFVIVKNKSNPEETFLLMGENAIIKDKFTAIFGGSREIDDNKELDSCQYTIKKELFEETMGTVDLTNEYVDQCVKKYGVHIYNVQDRVVLKNPVDDCVHFDRTQCSYEFQTSVVEIEVDNPKEWIKNLKSQKHVQVAQSLLAAFGGYLHLQTLRKEQNGLTSEQCQSFFDTINMEEFNDMVNEVISNTPDGRKGDFHNFINNLKEGKPITADQLEEVAISLLNHTENKGYGLVELSEFQKAAKASVESTNLDLKIKYYGSEEKEIAVLEREAMIFERLRFNALKKGLQESLVEQPRTISRRNSFQTSRVTENKTALKRSSSFPRRQS